MLSWISLLPLATFFGWQVGKNEFGKSKLKNKFFSRDYFVGLNFLLNEQPDEAVDVFIKMLEVDSSTVETHLALGSLFRRRGEVDRAIRIHQNLIARPTLSKQEKILALLALGQDYLRAGVFDRAERLFLEVVESGEQTTNALRHLLTIYECEKNWIQAITIANKLLSTKKTEIQTRIAHYYCELALLSRRENQLESVQKNLRLAFKADPHCVRASILFAEIEFQAGEYKNAIRYYQNVKDQDPDYLSEIVQPLAVCYEHLKKEENYFSFLQECSKQYPRISILLAIADYLQRQQGDSAAIEFISAQLYQHPSIRGLHRLINLNLENVQGDVHKSLLILRDITIQLLRSKPTYRCYHCGYHGKLLHWHCPSCKNWGTIKPIHGMEGE